MATSVDEIAPDIYRLSTFVPDIGPDGFTFNQFLIDDDEPLLFHTGHRSMFTSVCQAIERVLPVSSLRWITFGHVESTMRIDEPVLGRSTPGRGGTRRARAVWSHSRRWRIGHLGPWPTARSWRSGA